MKMKKTTLTLIMMLASCMAFSQGVAINEDGTAPHASAMLEVTSTEKGVLIPRMTQAQRDAINEPAPGLLIYQSDETPGFYYNAGTPATPDWQMVGSNAGTFSQWTESGNNIYFNEGNVGIGLDNPQHQLHINLDLKAGEGRFGSIPQNILGLGPDFFGGETGLFDIDADKLIAGKDYTSGVYQYGGTPGSSEGLFINSGKLGIGIQNPEQKLHVAGNAYFGDNYPLAIAYDLVYGELGLFKVDKDLLIAGILNPGQNDLIYQYGGFAGSNEGLFIKSGNLGIGIQNPTHKLDIDGLVRIRKGDPGPGKVLTSDADGVASWETPEDTSKWSETGNNIYRIEGNVGIGASEPAALLHTSGTGQGEGNLLFEGIYKPSSPGDPPAEGPGTRMMWYPDKSAFRVGEVDGNQWNKEQIGFRSFASGLSTTASGHHSTAMGHETTASGLSSTAIGFETQASGDWSTAIGIGTIASGSQSTALGVSTTAPSFAETAIGIYNTPYIPQSPVMWNENDRLFVIGNGLDDPSNAITVLKSGNTGIGTDTPTALLHTYGTGEGQGNVLHVGENKYTDPGPAPIEGAGTRMMWYPDKAAFRVGGVTGTQWDTENIGHHSTAWGGNTTASGWLATAWGAGTTASGHSATAWGENSKAFASKATAWGQSTTASGGYATAWGWYTTASQWQSTAWGRNTTASGNQATAWGYETTASHWQSTAWGSNTTASGTTATAWGENTTAPSAFETALGRFNTNYTPASATGWNANDRLFVIGNGTAEDERSNAMTVLKNGNIGIGTDEPEGNRLRVISSASGSAGATGYFENEDDSGIALRADTDSDDGTMLVTQHGSGYSLRLDGYDPNWFVAMIVKGRQVGINTTSLGSFNLAVNGSAAKTGGGSWSNLSDARLKTINGNYTKGLNEIVALQAVNFHYIEDNPYGFDPKSAQIGFIAQEVREIFPEAVSTGDDGYLNFNMHAINVALVNAIKELKLENDKLKTENEKLRSTDEQLISRIERLEMLIASFSENQ